MCDNTHALFMDNLFDGINEKMFSLLTAEDKRGNFELLAILHSLSSSEDYGDFIPKEEAVGALSAYLEDHSSEFKSDGDGTDLAHRSNRDKALIKLRQFRRLGWIDEDSLGGYNAVISFTSAGKAFAEFLIDFSATSGQPLEYTGYVYVIYSTLLHFDLSKSTALLQQVHRLTKELMNSLSRLSSEIKAFLNDLLESKDLSPQEILDTLLRKYQKQVVLRVFNNLRMHDNPSRYSSSIIAKLRELLTDHMDELVANSVMTEDVSDLTRQRYLDIENKIRDQVGYVIASFESIERYLDILDGQNTKYLSSARARLEFLLNSGKDVSGRIKEAIRLVGSAPESYEFEKLVRLESSGIIDARSLSSPRFQREKALEVETIVPEGDQEEVGRGLEAIFEEDPFSKENVNAAALAYLMGESEIPSQDIPTENQNDLILLMMMQLISGNRGLDYQVDLHEERYERAEHEITAFTLKRKERRNGRKE